VTRSKKLWIAWDDDGSIRSRVLAKEMKAAFYTFTLFGNSKYLSVLRYPIAILQTFFTLIKERPDVFIVPNPSTVLAFFSALVKPIFNYMLIIDEHTPFPEGHALAFKGMKKLLSTYLSKHYFKQCDILIVTKELHKARINNATLKEIFILPDKIPAFDYEFEQTPLKGQHNILYICSFLRDEPWKEVIRAAELLDKDTYMYISGRNTLDKDDLPQNVVLTGFIPNKDYQNLLRSVDIVMVLSTKQDSLLCGAYEAVAAEKPLILSEMRSLMEYFNTGTVFTKNNSKDIAHSIHLAIKDNLRLKEGIQELKKTRDLEWREKWNNLLKKLS